MAIDITIPETTWAYLAGMVDGEGCIMLFRHYKNPKLLKKWKGSNRGYELEPRVNINSMNKHNIEFIKNSICGLGNIVVMRFKREGEVAAIGYDLRFYPNAQRIILPKIIPYLVQKKERAIVLMKLLDYRSQKNKDPIFREKLYLQLEDEMRGLIIKEKPWLIDPPGKLKLGVQNTSLVKAYHTHSFVAGRKDCLSVRLQNDKTGDVC
jgi:hypothetical protein